MEKTLQVGFAKIDTTPDFPIGLSGYGGDKTRLWEKVEERLYTTCIAVANGEKTLLLYTCDILAVRQELQERFRKVVSQKTGIPEEHIFFGAIHAHNAPSPWFKIFLDFWEEKIIEAAETALGDLCPATLFVGKKELSGMNFTRHYLSDKGEKFSFNAGIPKDAVLVGHVTKNDPDLTVLKFEREGKKDVVLMNFQAHCDFAYGIGFTSLCPSWAGRMRDKLESLVECHAAYFTGTSGNQAAGSRIPGEAPAREWFEYGEQMGVYAAQVLASPMEKVEGSDIRSLRYKMPAEINTSDIHLYDKALQARDIRATDRDAATKFCHENGIRSLCHANGIIARKGNLDDTLPYLELNAFSIGNLGIVTNTNETCSDQGLFVKEHTPFKHTFIITGNSGYLGTEEMYEYGAYEAIGWSGFYVKGTAEKMADTWVKMLNVIHE